MAWQLQATNRLCPSFCLPSLDGYRQYQNIVVDVAVLVVVVLDCVVVEDVTVLVIVRLKIKKMRIK